MSPLNKILISITAIIAICLASLIIYKQFEISNRQKAIEESVVKQKELSNNIMRSMSEYATKEDMVKFANDSKISLKDIQKDMDKLQADVKAINTIIVSSSGYKKEGVGSTGTGPKNPNPQPNPPTCNGEPVNCPNTDVYGYMQARQDLDLNEPFGNTMVPIGKVGFSAWNSGPWTIDIRHRTYRVTSVVGVDENQRQYFYNKFTINVDGKDYDLRISSATTKQEYPEAKFSWWNPRLFLGVEGGLNLSQIKGEFSPNLSVGFMSYGRYKIQPDFSFLQLGLGYGIISDRIQFSVTPFTYNIGKHIPLMNNMYLGPSLYFGTNGNTAIMGGIKVAL